MGGVHIAHMMFQAVLRAQKWMQGGGDVNSAAVLNTYLGVSPIEVNGMCFCVDMQGIARKSQILFNFPALMPLWQSSMHCIMH